DPASFDRISARIQIADVVAESFDLFEPRFDDRTVAYYQDRHLVRRQVLIRDAVDVLCGNGLNVSDIVVEIAVRKSIDDKVRKLTGDLPDGFETGREPADQALFAVFEFRIGKRNIAADAVEFLHKFDDGFFCHRGLDTGRSFERAGAFAKCPAWPRTVCIAFILTKIHIHSRGELAAEDRIHYHQRKI